MKGKLPGPGSKVGTNIRLVFCRESLCLVGLNPSLLLLCTPLSKATPEFLRYACHTFTDLDLLTIFKRLKALKEKYSINLIQSGAHVQIQILWT